MNIVDTRMYIDGYQVKMVSDTSYGKADAGRDPGMALPQHRHDPISFIFIPSGVVLLPANQIRLGAAPLKGIVTKEQTRKQDNCLWPMLIPETAVSFA